MKKFIPLFLGLVSVYGNAATLDISGLSQKNAGGKTVPVIITGVAAGELLFTTGTPGIMQSRVIATSDLPSSIPLSKLATDPLDRANHTGTQDWSTIINVPDTLDGIGITADYQLADGRLDEWVSGSITNSPEFLGGYTSTGKVIGTYSPTVGTVMQLDKRGYHYTVAGNGVALTFAGTPTLWQQVHIKLTATGTDRILGIPEGYPAGSTTPITSIPVKLGIAVYFTYVWEGTRWGIIGTPPDTTGDGEEFVLSDAPTINNLEHTGIDLWEDGVTQEFNPDATHAGIAFGSVATDPVTVKNGAVWYNSTAGKIKSYQGGSIVEWGTGGGGGADFDTSDELADILTDESGDSGGFVRQNDPVFTGNADFVQIDSDEVVTDTITMWDSNGSHRLIINYGSNITADRSLDLITGDADRTIILSGDPTLGDWFNQSVKTSASPTFAGGSFGAATATSPAAADDDTSVATTEWVQGEIAGLGGGSSDSIATYRQNIFLWEEFLQRSSTVTTAAHHGEFNFQRTSSGSGATGDSETGQTGAPGIASLETGTTTTGYSILRTGDDSIYLGGGSYTIEGRFWLPVATGSGEDYSFIFGLHDSVTALPIDGCYFLYDTASANWQINNRDNSTGNPSASSTAVAIAGWVKLQIVVNAGATSVAYYVNGVQLNNSPLTSNIPDTVNRQVGIRFGIIKSAGTTTREVWCDYVGMEVSLTSGR